MNLRDAVSQRRVALLVMDFHAAAIDLTKPPRAVLSSTATVLGAARSSGRLVIFVRVAFRSGYPELSASNSALAFVRVRGLMVEGDGTEIHPLLAPAPDEIIVTKHRTGPFLGTDLDQILRAQKIDTLALTGLSTSGVVLSTVREAADRDYGLVVVSDCCFDPDQEVHEFLMKRLFPRHAAVISADELIAAFTDS